MPDKQSVYDDIKEQIISEKLQPGQWLIERELCSTYGLSRTPVRGSSGSFWPMGFSSRSPTRALPFASSAWNRSSKSSRPGRRSKAWRPLAAARDERRCVRLTRIRKTCKVNVEAEIARGVALGRKLHRAIMEAAHNDLMAEISVRLGNLTALTSNITKKSTAIEKQFRDAHCRIIDALLERTRRRARGSCGTI